MTPDLERRKAELRESWARGGHFSHHRVLSGEEEAERRAVTFEPIETVEIAFLVGQRHPELADQVAKELRPESRTEYLERRRSAELHDVFAPDPALERLVDEAVATLAALVEPPTLADDVHRQGFAAAVIAGSRADEALLFRRWLDDRAATFGYRSRRAALRARLGLTGGNPPGWLTPPKFSDEVDEAWSAYAVAARRRTLDPSRPPAEPTRRVPPVQLDDSPGDQLAAAAADASDGDPVSVARATLATLPDGVREAPPDAAPPRRSQASSRSR